LKLVLADAPVHERTVLVCHGTPADRCTRQEHIDKFRWLAGSRLSAAAITELAGLIDATPTLATARELTAPLRGTDLHSGERQKA
jgi:hypothetical protein